MAEPNDEKKLTSDNWEEWLRERLTAKVDVREDKLIREKFKLVSRSPKEVSHPALLELRDGYKVTLDWLAEHEDDEELKFNHGMLRVFLDSYLVLIGTTLVKLDVLMKGE